MNRTEHRYCWTASPDTTVWIVDVREGTGGNVDVRSRVNGRLVRLDIRRDWDTYVIQDLKGAVYGEPDAFRAGFRRKGLGTLVVNTALSYLRDLADPLISHVTGTLSTSGDVQLSDEPGEVRSQREGFAARFGLVAESEKSFRVRLDSLAPVQRYQLMGMEVRHVPFSEFGRCAHEHT